MILREKKDSNSLLQSPTQQCARVAQRRTDLSAHTARSESIAQRLNADILLSVIASLGNAREFHRLRIGVGHPGDKNAVTAYLTSVRMPAAERTLVEDACELSESTLGVLLRGQMQQAMNLIHAPGQPSSAPDEENN